MDPLGVDRQPIDVRPTLTSVTDLLPVLLGWCDRGLSSSLEEPCGCAWSLTTTPRQGPISDDTLDGFKARFPPRQDHSCRACSVTTEATDGALIGRVTIAFRREVEPSSANVDAVATVQIVPKPLIKH
jgi:hypothetical protein